MLLHFELSAPTANAAVTVKKRTSTSIIINGILPLNWFSAVNLIRISDHDAYSCSISIAMESTRVMSKLPAKTVSLNFSRAFVSITKHYFFAPKPPSFCLKVKLHWKPNKELSEIACDREFTSKRTLQICMCFLVSFQIRGCGWSFIITVQERDVLHWAPHEQCSLSKSTSGLDYLYIKAVSQN